MKIKKKELFILQELVNKLEEYNEIQEERKEQSRKEKKTKKYLKKHNASGLKVGDIVKVIGLPMDSQGWTMNWIDEMNDTVFNIYEIIDDCDTSGFRLNTSNDAEFDWCYPYFVLEKVEDENYESEAEVKTEDCMNCDCPCKDLYDEENTKFLVEFLDDADGEVDIDYMTTFLKNHFLSKIAVTEL